MVDCVFVAFESHPCYDCFGYTGGVRVVAKFFTFVDVADVNFDGFNSCSAEGVAKGDACVRVGGWVEYDAVAVVIGELADFVDECAFGV